MSDQDKPFEFSASDLMPDWAQETPGRPEEKSGKKARPPRESEGGRQRGSGRGRRDDRGRSDSRHRDHSPRDHGRHGDDRRGGRRDDRGGRAGWKGGRGDGRKARGGRGQARRDEPRQAPSAPEGVEVAVEPAPATLVAFAKHLHESIRAYPLADLAKMILGSRDRYQVRFRSRKPGLRFHQCKRDGAVWLTREEAVAHLLGGEALESLYRVEEIDTGAPKGNFTAVAVCGFSGEILGPPNHHEYQLKLARLHAERFSHMPLEKYRSRIRMENDEETIEKWKAEAGRKRQYRVRNDPGAPTPSSAPADGKALGTPASPPAAAKKIVPEPEKVEESAAEASNETEPVEPESHDSHLSSDSHASGADSEEQEQDNEAGLEDDKEKEKKPEEAPADDELVITSEQELARHFREHFAAEEIAESDEVTIPGDISGKHLSRGLLEHLKAETEKLRRGFPLPMVQALCRDLEKEGFKFFKRGKKSLHVSAVRPQAIPESADFTNHVRSIVNYVVEHPRAKVIELLETLVPGFEPPSAKPEDKEKPRPLSDAAKEVLGDLRWLKSLGYVIEFPDTSLALGRARPAKKEPVARKKAPAAERPAKERKGATGKAKGRARHAPETSAPAACHDDLARLDASDQDPHDPSELPALVDPVE